MKRSSSVTEKTVGLIPVNFLFLTGIKREIFRHIRLTGSWDQDGNYSSAWTDVDMISGSGEDGCPAFSATIHFAPGDAGKTFSWGLLFDGPSGNGVWGIPTEVHDANSALR